MSNILVTSVPIHGHVVPLLAVAERLVARGHRVRFLTGGRFADAVTATGATHVALPREADFDDRALRTQPSDARGTGIAALREDLQQVFITPARAQYRSILQELSEPADVLLTEPGFVGAVLLAGRERSERPPVVGVGVLPLLLSSADVAPYGLGLAPMAGPLNRVRNRLLQALAERVLFRPVQQSLDDLVRDVLGRQSADVFIFDGLQLVDAIVQLTVPAFEYPRHDLTVPLSFAGPIMRPSDGPVPPWWSDLEAAERVVLVTQGTLANRDMTELIRPTLDGLANTDLLVVVTTGGRPAQEVGPVPDNARVAEFLPYDRLFPLLDVMVTNGGYGGVHYALSHGVPLVAAGVSEDKPEVAARVAFSGTGIRLKTGRPGAPQVRDAVDKVLGEPSYAAAARRISRDIASSRGIDEIESVIARVT